MGCRAGRLDFVAVNRLVFILMVFLTWEVFPQERPCAPDLATADAFQEQLGRTARLAEASLAVLQEYQEFIGTREWKADVPLGEQMSSEEAEKFGTLRQRLLSQQFAQLLESKRERDIRIIGRMAILADKAARYGIETPEDEHTENYKLVAVLLAMRKLFPVDTESILALSVDGVGCSLDKALFSDALSAAKSAFQVDGWKEAVDALDELAKKYGTPVDEELMDAETRHHYRRVLVPIIGSVKSKLWLSEDLYRLGELEQVSKLMVESRRQSFYEAPGDFRSSGKTWDRWVATGKITARQEKLSGVINGLDEIIPSKFSRTLEQMQEATQ